MSYRRNYPRTVAEILNKRLTFRPETLLELRMFRRSRPWRGTPAERLRKFQVLHEGLCSVYGLRVDLVCHQLDGGSSGSSCYVPGRARIILSGRLSVVTYLHELGHARGWDERQAVRWSVNLFRRVFPRSFARCRQVGHMLLRGGK